MVRLIIESHGAPLLWLVYLAIYHIFFLPRFDISLGERVKQDQEDTTKFWKVNAVIKYAPEEKSLEVARYHFGRTFSELNPAKERGVISHLLEMGFNRSRKIKPDRVRKLSAGLISLIEKAKLADKALEVGFQVQITTESKTNFTEWKLFVKIAESDCITTLDRTAVYAEPEQAETLSLISVDPFNSKLPEKIWVRVVEHSESMLASIISEGVLSFGMENQTTLDEYFDLGVESEFSSSRELLLPGPPMEGC
tara:strand:+ start:1494 stop:2249 length:756 start_codon:yes stop_codon:yes gene_type:complete